MQNEEISNRTISISTKSAEKTLRFLAKYGFKGLKALVKTGKRKLLEEGKQSYKRLQKSGQGLATMDITYYDDIKIFKAVAKEYKMDFAVKQDKDTGVYTLYFKAKDGDIYDKVFSAFAKRLEEKANKKGVLKQLAEKKAEAQKINAERSQNMVKKIFKEHEKA